MRGWLWPTWDYIVDAIEIGLPVPIVEMMQVTALDLQRLLIRKTQRRV